ncbi:MAG: hypothetical protein M1833_005926 [Piccolia ochrophora]|nr:MAG: hypothetical protein M1833_005926 [Piccolia ochrophora]
MPQPHLSRRRPPGSGNSTASTTATMTERVDRSETAPASATASGARGFPNGATLRLRVDDSSAIAEEEGVPSRRVTWAEDVVDNEGMGKKKSKVCCIYHKPRPVGESSDESSSSSGEDSSSSDSDSDVDDGSARPVGGRKARRRHGHGHGHGHEHGHEHDHGHGRTDGAKGKQRRKRRASPNAYEKMPK